ncbi:MAG TPA: hypothetical protein VJZ71_10640 [Phycisphaerae bacterium]|nr:hypothetical protein [Phycisphaerae bacterium]
MIPKDGLLLVSRRRYLRYFGDVPFGSVNKLVRIQKGEAILPTEIVLASLWLMPNEFAIGMNMAGFSTDPLRATLHSPWMFIPMPGVSPAEEVWLVPLVRDYLPDCPPYCGSPYATGGYKSEKRVKGAVKMRAAKNTPTAMIEFLKFILFEMEQRPKNHARAWGPDLKLSATDRRSVRDFIEQESERLLSMDSQEQHQDFPHPTSLP